MKDLIMAKKIAEKVREKGGRTFFVGGFVRDKLLKKENKDIDIEIHNITPQDLREVLSELGTITEMGASFGILGLKGYDIDIAQPRSEMANGRGHKDFEIFVDPFIGTKNAAKRRDFTINALMEDVLTGEIIDHFNGLNDLNKGIIRHINNETFIEDPLRVFRAPQFAARFGFSIANETIELSKTMDLTFLPKERVLEEMKKALLKSNKPSIFFEELRKMNQLKDWFPELEALIDVPQNPIYHPEGDVWNHTMMVLDNAALLKNETMEPFWFMIAALVHDFGKIITTKEVNGVIRSLEHEIKGLPLVEKFLDRISTEVKLKEYVLNLTKLHMKPNQLVASKSKKKVTNKMFDEAIDCKGLLLLAKSDHLGRKNAKDYNNEEKFLTERLKWYEETMKQPEVMGRDLIKAGLKPGPHFTELLILAHKLHLANVDKKSALAQVLAEAKKY